MWTRVIGVLLVVVGAVWFLQGIDVLGGSFMSGQIFWAVVGLPMVVIGLAVLFPKRLTREDGEE
jgi:hypothetical protein